MNSNVKCVNRTTLGYAVAMALASVLVASNAHADEPVRSETVKFADLDLGTSAGVEALYTRIHAAARRVCDQLAGEQAAVGGCMTKAESSAIGRVNTPLLTAFYQKKTGTQPQTITANR
jgi:UrcA family protein